MADKIQMTTPLVEMDGDEMTRIIWKMIKDILITPYVDLKTDYYDLGLVHRNETNDQVTIDSANATKKYGVAVKCATITPNAQRMTEYNLKEMWKSPNGTIRAILDGTVFRKPILVKGIVPYIPTWTKPITIARHAYGDIYKNTEMKVAQGSKAELVVTDKDGRETRALIHDFKNSDGVVQGVHNLDKSISSFARACFNYALGAKESLWFAAKDTTTVSRTSSPRSTRTSTRRSSQRLALSTSTPSSTMLSQELSAPRAASSGRARTTTATLCPTCWRPRSAPWV